MDTLNAIMDTVAMIDSIPTRGVASTGDLMIIATDSFSIKHLVNSTIANSSSNQFLQGGLVIAALTSIWVYFKGIPAIIWRYIRRNIEYTATFDSSNTIYYTFSKWYASNFPQKFQHINPRLVLDRDEDVNEYWYHRDNKEVRKHILSLHQNNDTNILWRGIFPLIIRKSRRELQNANSISNRYIDEYKISGFFAKKKILKLLEEIKNFKNELDEKEKDDSINAYHHTVDGWNKRPIKNYKKLDNIFIDNKDLLLKDLNRFRESIKKINELGLSAKRGYLFYGEPGNGKTSLIIALAEYLNVNVYFFNLKGISDGSFKELIDEIESPAIIAIEDVDTFVENRFGSNDKSDVSFSTLLNTLNGSLEPDNCIFVLTTNKKERLDPALIRSGRIDFQLEVTNPSYQTVADYLSYVSGVKVTVENPCEISSIPMASIQDLVLRNIDTISEIETIEMILDRVKEG